MSEVIKVSFVDHSTVKVAAEQYIIMEIRQFFTHKVDGYQFSPKHKFGGWNGDICLMSYDGDLPFGLVGSLEKFASNMMYDIEVDPRIRPTAELTRPEFDEWLEKQEIYSGENKITPHWYQADSVFHAINNQKAILNLPTSAGKSLVQSLLCRWYLENFDGKVLIIVPNIQLVGQMSDDFQDYRLFPRGAMNLIGGNTQKYPNHDALITITTWQSAVKKPTEWFRQFGMVINDECHLSTSKSISTILKGMKHTAFKFGLTGSLRDGKCNIMTYVGTFGEIFRPVDTAKLIEDGQVSDIDIKSIFLEYPQEECIAAKGLDYANEIKLITSHKKRNAWVCNLAKSLASRDENVLVLFKNVAHGKALFKAIQAIYGEAKVRYISGEVKASDRTEMSSEMEDGTGLILVASYGCLSTGVSIKRIHHLVLAHPVKSKILVLQSLGRVLRKHDTKAKATVFDVIDNLSVRTKSPTAKKMYSSNNYAFKHGIERIKRFNQEKFNYDIKKIPL